MSRDVDGDCDVKLYSVDGSGNVSANGAGIELSTNNISNVDIMLWDSTHALCRYSRSTTSIAIMVSFDTSAGTVAEAGTELSVGLPYQFPSMVRLTGANSDYVCMSASNQMVMTQVDTSTWAITAPGSVFTRSADNLDYNGMCLLDEDALTIGMCYWNNTDNDTYVNTYTINDSTWAITTFGTELNIGGMTSGWFNNNAFALIGDNGTGMLTFARDLDSGSNYGAQTFTLNKTTGNLTLADRVSSSVAESATGAVVIDQQRYVAFWRSSVQAFDVEVSSISNNAIFPCRYVIIINMCTKQEVEQAVEETLFAQDSNGLSNV